MAVYGYARVSTKDQDLSIQHAALTAAGCEIIRSEKITGTTRHGREELDTLLAFIRAGDVLVCTRIDRLARSVGDLQDVVREIQAKGAALRCTEQAIDTGTPEGRCFLNMLATFAQFETEIRRERQLEGIAKAKTEGKYKGRPASIDVETVRKLKAQGFGATEIADRLAISRGSVYRVLGEQP